MSMKYSDLLVRWLKELGYTHCFFVAGGNVMHLLDGVRKEMTCIATVHEVAAGIAAEYFNEVEPEGRAFAMVTAGPGLTNLMTALGGAYLESRELLVLGGQAKAEDLAGPDLRQRGIQEIDGVALAAPVCKAAVRIEVPAPKHEIERLVRLGREGRPGPVFLELCLDAQGAPVEPGPLEDPAAPAVGVTPAGHTPAQDTDVPAPPPGIGAELAARLASAQRPVLLLGGGLSREAARAAVQPLRGLGVPLMTTWNGMDRVSAGEPLWFGRPNTWGMRASNVLLQQADLVIALGTRLGLQQTGFNWQQFAPMADVVQVDVDPAELEKGHPHVDLPVQADAAAVLRELLAAAAPADVPEWVTFCGKVRALLPTAEAVNTTGDGYVDPYVFTEYLSVLAGEDDLVVPCSSGGAFTVTMQSWLQKTGQRVVTNKGLASMGYGLSGAIGAAFAHPGRRVIHIEGDGGFAQNLQEIATVSVNALPLKMFIFSNEGYASIRMTQRNYFGGQYLGCDTQTGLGFPDWAQLFAAFAVPTIELGPGYADDSAFRDAMAASGPAAFIVPIDPEQTYFPKISSRVTASGSMESNPLHLMSPDLAPELAAEVLPHTTTGSTA